jgi:hypothetical protein
MPSIPSPTTNSDGGSPMTPQFNSDEQKVLRFLEKAHVEGHREPHVLTGPATSPAKVKAACGIDDLSYRRAISLFESLGIAEAIAPRASDEWIKVDPKIVGVVREIDSHSPPQTSALQPPPAESRPKPIQISGSNAKPMSKNFPKGWVRGEQLGEGGQAQVFIATREGDSPGQKHAVKLLRKGKPKAAYERFAREIEAVKKLNHPSIMKIMEHSEPDADLQYYVMEYVEGARSLKQLMRSGENPFRGNEAEAVRFFIRILDALERCKASEIVHRDLSPANILVLPDKSIKIIDFGLCQIADGHAVSLTDENIGTPNYMAPECESFSAMPITFCADLYSAAKILWAAITNQDAFAREMKVFDELSMQRLFPTKPAIWHLQIIFEHSIRQKVADRWATASDALAASWRIHQMIEKGTFPIENLERACPMCGWGSLSPADAPVLVNAQPEFFELACSYCGYCFVINRKIRQKTLAARKNLS